MKRTIRQELLDIARNRIAISLGISAKELASLSGCSPTTALSVIAEIIDAHPGLMIKTAKRWSVINEKDIPRDWLSDFSITKALSEGNAMYAGILPGDIRINKVRFTARNSVADTAIVMAVRASRYREAGAFKRGAIRIKYVGLRIDEQARWRTIVPITLEEFSGKWRIIGIDAEINESRTFQLSRIIEVDDALHPIPLNLDGFDIYSPKRRVNITLSKRLSDDQRTAVENELGLNSGGLLQLTEGQLHDMRHQYGIDKPSDQIVWPLIEKLEVI